MAQRAEIYRGAEYTVSFVPKVSFRSPWMTRSPTALSNNQAKARPVRSATARSVLPLLEAVRIRTESGRLL
jgi:hypothetical protein